MTGIADFVIDWRSAVRFCEGLASFIICGKGCEVDFKAGLKI